MCSLLLKKALPFALTFMLGSLIGGLFKLFGVGGRSPAPSRPYYYYGYSYGGHSCRMRARQRYLVAESKPLLITFKPDARWPRGLEKGEGTPSPVRVRVTFGADGRVQQAEMAEDWPTCCAGHAVANVVEQAAKQIQFEPETVDGVPVAVTRDVEIHFMAE